MQKPFLELDCPDYQEINADILDYLENRTLILQKDPRQDPSLKIPYPNFVDKIDFIKHNPKMAKYLNDHDMKLFNVYYAVTFYRTVDNCENFYEDFIQPSSVSSCPIHLDRPPVQWKMNWPVMNMIGTGVRFFRLKDEHDDIKNYLVRSGEAGSSDRDMWNLPYEPFDEWHRHIFKEAPILMNGLIPHDVWFPEHAILPRIGLQIMFIKEPRHLLDNNCVILQTDFD